ncbi:hypothetical protein FRB93_013183 [Tulasnella sp. JGI-2019a]|nr:hypothetical protein FRB93_013183 [Tulasnella sp. JGI-2019a]
MPAPAVASVASAAHAQLQIPTPGRVPTYMIAPVPAPALLSLMLRTSQPTTAPLTARALSKTPTEAVPKPTPGSASEMAPVPALARAPVPVPPPNPISRPSQPSITARTLFRTPANATPEPAPGPAKALGQVRSLNPMLPVFQPSTTPLTTRELSRTLSEAAPTPTPPTLRASQPSTFSLPPRALYPMNIPLKYCHRCHVEFTSDQEQVEHEAKPINLLSMATDGTDRPRCNKCKRAFSTLQSMRLHLICGTQAHENSCADCLFDFHNARGLQEHKDSVHRTSGITDPTEGRGSTPSRSGLPTNRRPPSPITSSRPLRNPTSNQPRRSGLHANSNENSAEPDPWGLRRVVTTSGAESASGGDRQTSDMGSFADTRTPRGPPAEGQSTAVSQRITGNAIASASPGQERAGVTNADTVVANPTTSSSSSSQKTKQNPVATSRQTAPRKSAISVPCPLCLDTAMDLTSTPCGHTGCLECLTQSVKIRPECPVCRTALTLGQLHPLFL